MNRVFVTLLLAGALAGCSTTPVPAEKARPVPADRIHGFQAKPQGDFGTMVVTRDAGLTGSGCYVVLKIDGDKAASFGTSETATFLLEPGEKVAEISTGICGGGPREREVIIKAGESRRYRISVEMGAGYSLTRTNH